MIITIEDYRAVSWNSYYGLHWSGRAGAKRFAKALVREKLDPNEDPFDVPVDIEITAYYTDHLPDPDNIAAKLLIDGLIDFVLVDDAPKYVSSVTTRARNGDTNRVVMQVLPTTGED